MAKFIEYSHNGLGLTGYFVPSATMTKAPGILIVPAWLGATDSIKLRADRLAQLGYSVFVADMFGKPVDIAAGPKSAVGPFRADRLLLRQHVRAGLEVLVQQPECDAARIAAIGYCFGGNAILELARDGANLKGFVSFHGELDTPYPAQVGDIKGKLLVLAGDDDPVVPFDEISAFRDEMRAAEADFEITVYSGAKHSFTGEGSLGAAKTPEAVLNVQADNRSWQRMLNFFSEIFDGNHYQRSNGI